MQAATHVNDKKEGVLEGVSDTIINAFTKVKQKDDRFTAIRSHAEKLEANLNDIEKVGAKVTKRQSDLVMDFEDLNSSLTELGNVETDLRVQLDSFGRTLLNNGAIMKEFVRHGIIALRKDLTPGVDKTRRALLPGEFTRIFSILQGGAACSQDEGPQTS